MKQSLAWHKESLKNWQESLFMEMDKIRRLNDEVARMIQDINAYDAQIIEAETRGLDGFDSQRFGKKRNGRQHSP